MRLGTLALAWGVVSLLAGCGASPTLPGSASWTRPAAFRQALLVPFATAMPRATQRAHGVGADFRLAGVAADEAFDADGTARPTRWRFEFYGHATGAACISLLETEVGTDGLAFLAPQQQGCEAGGADTPLAPAARVDTQDPASAVRTALAGPGKTYPPATPISFAMRPGGTAGSWTMTFAWLSTRGGASRYVTASLDAATGRLTGQETSQP